MKNAKYALRAACIMAAIACLAQALFILEAKMTLDMELSLLTYQETKEPQYSADILSRYHNALCWHLIGFSWYFVISALLIFAIRRLRNSN